MKQFIAALLAFIARPQTIKHKQKSPTFKPEEDSLSGLKELTIQRFFHARAIFNDYHLVKKRRLRWIIAGSAVVMACIWLEPIARKPVQNELVSDGLPSQEESYRPSRNDFFKEFDPATNPRAALVTQDLTIIMTEALTYTRLLQQYDDQKISSQVKSLKYQNLALAATLISATSEAKPEQQKWSAMAIEFGRIARESMNGVSSNPASENRELMDELNTRRLIAMALNYYQGGTVKLEDLTGQYQIIDKSFLVRKGFCRYKILRTMDKDGIIQLPGFSTAKYI